MTDTTWSTPPRRIATASRGCASFGVASPGRSDQRRARRPGDASDFACCRRAAAALRQLPERKRLQGARELDRLSSAACGLRAAERTHGRTSWSLYSLIGLSIEGSSFSVAPLAASLLGLLLAGAAFVFGVQIMIETFVYGQSVPGYPSVIVD